MEEIRLPDLEVIKRFSIAVRAEHASAADVLDALRADLETVTKAARARASSATAPPPPDGERSEDVAKIVAPQPRVASRPAKPASRAPAKPAARRAPAKPARGSGSSSRSRRSR